MSDQSEIEATAEAEEKKSSKKDKKKNRAPRRSERRFIAKSAYNPWLVRVIGALGGLGLGAGTWAYFYGESFKQAADIARATSADSAMRIEAIPAYIIAAAAMLTGVAIWLGTSAELPLRVGAPGIAMEKGEVRRMPWWGVSQISWEEGNLALLVAGKDESGETWTFKVPLKAHAEAASWILKEALERIPKLVDIRDDVIEKLPGANAHAGTKIELEPLQVVGKKDAITGKIISYEPDARVCVRCERVYFKRSVPKKCKCGASLAELRSQVAAEDLEDEEEDDDDSTEER